jgi:hypothetical protein
MAHSLLAFSCQYPPHSIPFSFGHPCLEKPKLPFLGLHLEKKKKSNLISEIGHGIKNCSSYFTIPVQCVLFLFLFQDNVKFLSFPQGSSPLRRQHPSPPCPCSLVSYCTGVTLKPLSCICTVLSSHLSQEVINLAITFEVLHP